MNDQRSTIARGFRVERPAAFLAWATPLVQVHDMLSGYVHAFRDGIIDAQCTVLDGLECSLLLHGPRGHGPAATADRLTMISFWKQGDFRATFDEMQSHLERTFGPPHETIPGGPDWPAEYKWVIDDVVIGHYAGDKGTGPQQRASIRKMY